MIHIKLTAQLNPVEFDIVDSEIREEVAAQKHRPFLTSEGNSHIFRMNILLPSWTKDLQPSN